MCVLVARAEAGDSRANGDPFRGIPVPGYGRHPDRRVSLDGGAACPTALRQVLRQVHLGESTGKPKPAVVGDDTDLAPAGIEEGFDAFKQQRDLLVDPRCQLRLQRMAELVEFTVLGPGATGSSPPLPLGEGTGVRVLLSHPRRDMYSRQPPGACGTGPWTMDARHPQ